MKKDQQEIVTFLRSARSSYISVELGVIRVCAGRDERLISRDTLRAMIQAGALVSASGAIGIWELSPELRG